MNSCLDTLTSACTKIGTIQLYILSDNLKNLTKNWDINDENSKNIVKKRISKLVQHQNEIYKYVKFE